MSLTKFLNNPESFQSFSKEELYDVIMELNSSYHNGKALIIDKEFDYLVNYYETKFNEKLNIIGAKPNSNLNIKKLPYALVSLNKVRTEEEIVRWKNNKQGNFYIQDKIDGATLLIGRDDNNMIRFYTRGGGRDGAVLELEHIIDLPYHNIPKGIYIRGELVIRKSVFGKLENYNGIRNVVSGFLNSKNPDPELGSKFNFYAYKIYAGVDLPMQDHFYQLSKWGFELPHTIELTNEDLTESNLEEYFKLRQERAEYEIDGLVIYTQDKSYTTIDVEGKNPKYATAFKVIDKEGVEAHVERIEWNISGAGLIIPLIKIHPITIETKYGDSIKSITISNITGHNARNVINNGIGPGAIISIGMNIIPVFIRTIHKSEEINLPEVDYKWDDKKVNFIVLDKNTPEIVKKQIVLCLKALEVKGFNEAKIQLFMNETDVLSVYDMYANMVFNINFELTKVSEGIILGIRRAMDNVILEAFMVSTGLFVSPFGLTNIKKMFEKYPTVLKEVKTKSEEGVVINLTNIGFRSTANKLYACLVEYLNLYEKYMNKSLTRIVYKLRQVEDNRNIDDKIEEIDVKLSKLSIRPKSVKELTINPIEPFKISEDRETNTYNPYMVALFKMKRVAIIDKVPNEISRFLKDVDATLTDKIDSDTIIIYDATDTDEEIIKEINPLAIRLEVDDLEEMIF